MALQVTLEDRTVQAALRRLARNTRNRRDVHRKITRRVRTRVQECFQRSADPWGGAWAPLKLRSGQPLRETNRLMNSIASASTSDATSSTIGTNVRYGIVHQFGATIAAQPGNAGQNVVGPRFGSPFLRFQAGNRTIYAKQVTVPARPFLPIRGGKVDLPKEWRTSVLEAVNSGLREGNR